METIRTYSASALKLFTSGEGAGRCWELRFDSSETRLVLFNEWKRLLSEHGRSIFRYDSDALVIDYDDTANYIWGRCDHTTRKMNLRVAPDWLADVITLWEIMLMKSEGEFYLPGRKSKTRGSRKQGYDLIVFYNCQEPYVPFYRIPK